MAGPPQKLWAKQIQQSTAHTLIQASCYAITYMLRVTDAIPSGVAGKV